MTFDPTLLRTVSHLARELSTGFDAHLKGMGLTSSRARVLILLTRHPDGVSQAAITEFLRVEHPTAVRILDGLEALGHVRRLPAQDDRRAKVVVLTELGKPLANAVVVLVKRLDAVLMDGLDRDEVNRANQLLGSLLERVLALKVSVASKGETAA